MARNLPIGRLTESVAFLSADPPAVSVTGLTANGTLATATTATAHGLRSGDYVAIAGAVPLGYNADSRQVVVVDATTFTYGVPAGLSSPATGAITVTFDSDSQGGHPSDWYSVGQAFAAIEPLNAAERLVAASVAAIVNYRAVVHYRTDLKARMKLRWFRYQEAAPRDLEIFGLYPHPEPTYSHRYLVIECGEVTA